MSIQRRSFIKSGLAAAGQVTAASAVLPAFEAEAATAFPTQNRAPLAPAAFLRLPPGAVKATGWLETQLGYQVNGLCGRFTEYSHFLNIDNNGWTNPDVAGGWEEVPYWLRGFVDLGFVTGDARVKTTAQQWIDRVLGTQAPDGFFGPANLRTAANGHLDYWPHMPMLHALRSHAEFTGDARIVPFLTRHFIYLNAQPGSVISDSRAC